MDFSQNVVFVLSDCRGVIPQDVALGCFTAQAWRNGGWIWILDPLLSHRQRQSATMPGAYADADAGEKKL